VKMWSMREHRALPGKQFFREFGRWKQCGLRNRFPLGEGPGGPMEGDPGDSSGSHSPAW
jgi:hypothetical protein